MDRDDIKFWSTISNRIMEEANEVVKPLVGNPKSDKIVKMGADGTPTKFIDLVAEEKVIEILEESKRPVTLISEEIGEFKIGKGPSEAVFVVDPLDGTRNAIKNIPAYGISIAVADPMGASKLVTDPSKLIISDVEVGFVKNFATGDIYSAKKGNGAFLNGIPIKPSQKTDVSGSSIGAYIYRAEMSKIDKLLKTVRSMRILGSVAIELCYVADGTYDAFLDIRGNLRIVDISAAKLIIEESKGIVTDENCQSLESGLNVLDRTSIIASCNKSIHKEIIEILGGI
ncbi:bifunctional fructose-bisphosphatase/inositol-phosphate phosphatase [Methanobacterium spitsbergense]|uniref:fructose-bisphosphatase n=1 Tax=Methanobacterium spitsbergense TaxID=2874285 RepID=A0A8T5UVY6_9EURY|nr:bifunctional fructose-bisphosphatase/inositol-phosphate phosphatase [Methanobacterium spitsbergense]MBZ2165340.1 bifunctional fructose-bisphosphatase/inositol-phosphate phosphatase [Methanobacterium spitsbergense]